MRGYIARRTLNLVPVLVGISLLAFSLSALAPGDPALRILRLQSDAPPTRAAVEKLRVELGLDAPFPLRYLRWLQDASRGDLGRSYRTGEPVLQALAVRFPATAQVAVLSTLVVLLVSLPLGVFSAVRRNAPVDHASRIWALIGASMPSFWLAYVLILIFAVSLRLLPVAGYGTPAHLVLPSVTLALGGAATLTRLTRSSLLETLGEDFVRTARAKGLGALSVIGRHALQPALIPVVTALGIRLGHLLAGAAIVETVFAWPGIGKFVVDSIYDRDYPVIQGFVLFTGVLFVLVNLLVDLVYVWIDPRIRIDAGSG
ncbi:MAG: nickel ABC transporter permease [Armatimonadota bacterium]